MVNNMEREEEQEDFDDEEEGRGAERWVLIPTHEGVPDDDEDDCLSDDDEVLDTHVEGEMDSLVGTPPGEIPFSESPLGWADEFAPPATHEEAVDVVAMEEQWLDDLSNRIDELEHGETTLSDDCGDDEQAAFMLDTSEDFVDAALQGATTYFAILENGHPLPSWLSIDARSGVLSGIPANNDVGDCCVMVTAVDEAGSSAMCSITLTVEDGGGGLAVSVTAGVGDVEGDDGAGTIDVNDARGFTHSDLHDLPPNRDYRGWNGEVHSVVRDPFRRYAKKMGLYADTVKREYGTVATSADDVGHADVLMAFLNGFWVRSLWWLHSMMAACQRLDPERARTRGRIPFHWVDAGISGHDWEKLIRLIHPEVDPRISTALFDLGIDGTEIFGITYSPDSLVLLLIVKFPNLDGVAGIKLSSTRVENGGKSPKAYSTTNRSEQVRRLHKDEECMAALLDLADDGQVLLTVSGHGATATLLRLDSDVTSPHDPARFRYHDDFLLTDTSTWVDSCPAPDKFRLSEACWLIRDCFSNNRAGRERAALFITDRDSFDCWMVAHRRAARRGLTNLLGELEELKPFNEDGMDQMLAELEESTIVNDDQHRIPRSTLVDPRESSTLGPWPQRRPCAYVGTTMTFELDQWIGIAQPVNASIDNLDSRTQAIHRQIRSLISETRIQRRDADAWTMIEVQVPPNVEDPGLCVDAANRFARQYRQDGSQNVLLHVVPALQEFCLTDEVYVKVDEAYLAVEVINSKINSMTRDARTIAANDQSSLGPDVEPWVAVIKEFNRRVNVWVTSLRESRFPPAEADADLIEAYFAYWTANAWGSQLSTLPGGHARPREKSTGRKQGGDKTPSPSAAVAAREEVDSLAEPPAQEDNEQALDSFRRDDFRRVR